MSGEPEGTPLPDGPGGVEPPRGPDASAERPPTEAPDLPEGWHLALPETIPRQTFVPAVLAAGLVILFWGFITTPILVGAGLGLVGFGVGGWIEELEFEERQQS